MTIVEYIIGVATIGIGFIGLLLFVAYGLATMITDVCAECQQKAKELHTSQKNERENE